VVDMIFYYGKEIIIIRLIDNDLYFCKVQGSRLLFAPIEGLKFSELGIKKEFPDLADKPFAEAKRIAIQRLKNKLSEFKTEKEKINYLREDLAKFGYVLKIISKPGCRPITWEAYLKNG